MNQSYQRVVAVKARNGPDFDEFIQMGFKDFYIRGAPGYQALAARAVSRRTRGPMVLFVALHRRCIQEGQPEQLLRRLVRPNDIEVLVVDRDHVGNGVECVFPIAFCLKKLLLGLFAPGNVADDLDARYDFAVRVPQGRGRGFDIPDPGAGDAVQLHGMNFPVLERHGHGTNFASSIPVLIRLITVFPHMVARQLFMNFILVDDFIIRILNADAVPDRRDDGRGLCLLFLRPLKGFLQFSFLSGAFVKKFLALKFRSDPLGENIQNVFILLRKFVKLFIEQADHGDHLPVIVEDRETAVGIRVELTQKFGLGEFADNVVIDEKLPGFPDHRAGSVQQPGGTRVGGDIALNVRAEKNQLLTPDLGEVHDRDIQKIADQARDVFEHVDRIAGERDPELGQPLQTAHLFIR